MRVTLPERFNHLELRAQSIDFVLDLLDDRSPHSRGTGLFNYGDTQISEMSPIISGVNVKDLRYTTESCYVAIPSIELTFVQVGRASRRAEEKI